MDLKQLRYFVRIAELGSLAKAADLLGVAQPTLSRQVRALEVDLNTNLFHRNGRGLQLTPEGSRFVEQAHGVLHAAEAAVQVLQSGDRRLSGRVVCGLTPSVGRMIIPEYIRRFRKALPDATATVFSSLSGTLHDQLKASRLDFAILHNPLPSPSLSIHPLGEQALYLVGTHPLGDHPEQVPLKALHELPLVMPSDAHVVRKTLGLAAARVGITLNVRFEVDVIEALFDLVFDGTGFTIATGVAVQWLSGRERLSVQRIVAPRLNSELALVTPVQRSLTPLQIRAADIARGTYEDLIARRSDTLLAPPTQAVTRAARARAKVR